MKNRILVLIVVCILATGGWTFMNSPQSEAATPHPKQPQDPPQAYLDGEPLTFDVPPPVIINGSTMVPLRGVFEAFGAKIHWDNRTKTVTAIKSGLEVRYTIGEQVAYKNGQRYTFASEPGRVISGRTMVPLRFVGESLDAYVEYEAATRSIFITSEPERGLPSVLNRYRLSLPYHTMLQRAPEFIAYVKQNADENSYLFFGDSQTWGAHLGRMQAHPYRVQQLLRKDSYNLGIPGFNDAHLYAFMRYVLEDVHKPNVVVQLQLFWEGSEKPYTGLDALLNTTLPSYDQAVSRLVADLHRDEEWAKPQPAAYANLKASDRAERIERGQQLFVREKLPHAAFINRLREMANWMATRPTQTFYVYIPPYYLDELTRHTNMTRADVERVSKEIERLFSNVPNVRFRDFNFDSSVWRGEHFVDWWHRTEAGEKLFAERMAKWLQAESR